MASLKQIAIRGAIVLTGAAIGAILVLYKRHQAIQAELRQERAKRLIAEKEAKDAATRKHRIEMGIYAAGLVGAVSVAGLASYNAYKFAKRVLE